MEKNKLFTGIFTCEACGKEYHCTHVPEKKLTCTDCGGKLIPTPKVNYYLMRWPPPRIIKREKSGVLR